MQSSIAAFYNVYSIIHLSDTVHVMFFEQTWIYLINYDWTDCQPKQKHVKNSDGPKGNSLCQITCRQGTNYSDYAFNSDLLWNPNMQAGKSE